MVLLEAAGQVRVPRNKSRPAGTCRGGFVLVPLALQQWFVGDENVDVLFERFESPRVLLVRQLDEFLHGRGLQQVGRTAGGVESAYRAFGRVAFIHHRHREGVQTPPPLTTLALHTVCLHGHGFGPLPYRTAVDQRIKKSVHEFFSVGR